MKLTKIKIKNFKSIRDIEIDVNKVSDSYTTMFMGLNESGKIIYWKLYHCLMLQKTHLMMTIILFAIKKRKPINKLI